MLRLGKAKDPRGEVKQGDLESGSEGGGDDPSSDVEQGHAEQEEEEEEEEEGGGSDQSQDEGDDEEEEEEEEEHSEDESGEAAGPSARRGGELKQWKRDEAKSFFYYRCKGDRSAELKHIDKTNGKKPKLRVGKSRRSNPKVGPTKKLSDYTEKARATYMNHSLERLTRLSAYFQKRDTQRKNASGKTPKRETIFNVISCVPHRAVKRIVCPALDTVTGNFVYEFLRFRVCYKENETFPVSRKLMGMRAIGMEEGKEHAFVMVQLQKAIASGTLFPIIHDELEEDDAALDECKEHGYPFHVSPRLSGNAVAVFKSAANNAHLLPATLRWSADQPIDAANCFVWNDCIMVCSGSKTVAKGTWLRCYWTGCRYFPPLKEYEVLSKAVVAYSIPKKAGKAGAGGKAESEEDRQTRLNRMTMLATHLDARTSTWAGYAKSKSGAPTKGAMAAAANQLNAYASVVEDQETHFRESSALKQFRKLQAEWQANHPEELELVAGILTDYREVIRKLKKDGRFKESYTASRAEPPRAYTAAEAKRFLKDNPTAVARTVGSASPSPVKSQGAASVGVLSPSAQRRARRRRRAGRPPVGGKFGTVDSTTSDSDTSGDGGDSDGPDWVLWE